MRMFIGVALPRGAARQIARVLESARAALGRGVVSAENLHITLDFLGEVDESRTADIRRAMLGAVHGSAPLHISTGSTGWFGRDLLYLGIDRGAAELAGIKEKLDTGLTGIGVGFDQKPYRPHITLARRADRGSGVEIAPVSFEAGGITLYQSERGRAGQVYTPLAAAAFTEGALRIDRIEGAFAVCENSGGGLLDIPVADLPFKAVEGMLISKNGADFSVLEQPSLKRLAASKCPETRI